MIFSEIKQALHDFDSGFEERENLLVFSSSAELCILQTGTGLPHKTGYVLTYFKGVPNDISNGILTVGYLKRCDKAKVLMSIELSVSDGELQEYTKSFFENNSEIHYHPYPLTENDVYDIYRKSI